MTNYNTFDDQLPAHLGYISSSWRPTGRLPPAMGTCMRLVCFVVVLCSLLHSTVSVHKKKIIVKVPHLIKHIHHDIYKPIHLHKIHSKKIEHHYEDDQETPKGWKNGQKKIKKEKNKNIHGSFSNLKPILLHQEIEEHMEYPGEDGQVGIHEFNRNHRDGHRLQFEQAPRQTFNNQEYTGWEPEEGLGKRQSRRKEEKNHFNKEKYLKREKGRLQPIDFSSWLNDDPVPSGLSDEVWDLSREDFHNRDQKYFSIGEKFSNKGAISKKSKKLRSRQASPQLESDGWKPMIGFDSSENFDDTDHGFKVHHGGKFINSGENYMNGWHENVYSMMQEEQLENSKRKKRKQKQQKKQNWNKQIETNHNEEVSSHKQVEKEVFQNPYQIESPQSQVLPQIQTQFFQPLQIHQVQPQATASQAQKSWPLQNWPVQQPATAMWHTQVLPQPQPMTTQAPKMVWSGHHLQMPQHSMWHLQQHSNGAPPLQVLTVDNSPLQTHPLQTHPLQIHSPQQLTQGSSPMHHVLPPDWPLTRKTKDSPVKQQWEQHVQTSGSNGPASSYKVEVINYMDQKSNR